MSGDSIVMNHFDHHTAASLADALSLLTKFGDEAKVIAGGTDLLVNIRNAAIAPRHVIDLKSARDLSRAEYSDHEGLRLGALLTLSDLASSEIICEKFNMLTQAALSIRSQQIRNMGTLGGNLCQDRKCVFYNQSHISLFQRQSLAPFSARSGKVFYLAGRDELFRAVV
ncbi:MAG: FAD binding domain-containing protein, partial [Candidatus Bathyarchaeia archaeon]